MWLGWPTSTYPSDGTIPGPGSDTIANVGGQLGLDRAMRLSSVWACVRLLADVVSTMPVQVYRERADGTRERVATPPVIANPSSRVLPTQWRYQVMVSLLLRGNAYGLIVARDRLGWPTQIELLHPDLVQVTYFPEEGQWVYSVAGERRDRDDVWHLPAYMLPGIPVGLSPIAYAAQAIGLGLGAEQFGTQFFIYGGHPSAILKVNQELSAKQAGEIKLAFRRATQGREPMVAGSGIDYTPIQISPQESQFLDTQHANAVTIARFFGVPPELIGAGVSGSSVTYANREQRAQDLLTFTVNGWLTRIEESLTAILPRQQFVEIDTTALLRSDTKTRYESYRVGLEAGFLDKDEVRSWEGLPPLDRTDDFSPSVVAEVASKLWRAVGVYLSAAEAREVLIAAGFAIPADYNPPTPQPVESSDAKTG